MGRSTRPTQQLEMALPARRANISETAFVEGIAHRSKEKFIRVVQNYHLKLCVSFGSLFKAGITKYEQKATRKAVAVFLVRCRESKSLKI